MKYFTMEQRDQMRRTVIIEGRLWKWTVVFVIVLFFHFISNSGRQLRWHKIIVASLLYKLS
jgi:hypothetical protein